MDKYIPKFEVLIPLFVVLVLNLLMYANISIIELKFESEDFTIVMISYLYFYIAITNKLNLKNLLYFLLSLSICSFVVNGNTQQVSLLMLVVVPLFFQKEQKIYVSLIKMLLAIILQYLLFSIYFNFLGNNELVYSIIYLPFSFLIHKGGVYVGESVVFKKFRSRE